MKAIQFSEFGGPEVLQLVDVADPVAGPGEVIIGVRAVGINPADTYMRGGSYRIQPALPCIPGGDAAGEVLAIGAGVEGLKPGDRVFTGAALGFDLTGWLRRKCETPGPACAAHPRCDFLRRGGNLRDVLSDRSLRAVVIPPFLAGCLRRTYAAI
ncbi:alcohol dehydrogenase catalytic domain-containing protein, partial [Pseudooceanicola sp.]|uniref:alcohol dehydrogenase catalytic domain-containing protein n=1 Tax=Pseudooceanicola sp. TaxID=1914328 RepID=UPI0026206273